jgi:hypothetical protein
MWPKNFPKRKKPLQGRSPFNIKKHMKQLLLSFLLKPKFIGQIVTWLASAIGGLVIAYLPMVPDIIQKIILALFDIPAGVELNQVGIAAAVAPFLAWLINWLVQRVLVKDNNAVLADLQPVGYAGKIDGHVGPVAKRVIDSLIRK